MSYQPPYTITPQIVQQVADIVELVTRWSYSAGLFLNMPNYRRKVVPVVGLEPTRLFKVPGF